MRTHPITGITSLTIGGESRSIACDMNCAAALHELKGDGWSQWLTDRFFGKEEGKARVYTPISPQDTITALYALLATDREDSGRLDENEKALRRKIGPSDLPDIQLALVKCVMASFGIPGEVIEEVIKAVDTPRNVPPAGTGTKRSASRSGR